MSDYNIMFNKKNSEEEAKKLCYEENWVEEFAEMYRGFNFVVNLNTSLGYRCGYVEIPVGNELYEKSYMDLDFESVELTFSGSLKNYPNTHWIGWDHFHFLDDCCDEDAIRKYNPEMSEDDINKIKDEYWSCRSEIGAMKASLENVKNEAHRVIDEIIDKFG